MRITKKRVALFIGIIVSLLGEVYAFLFILESTKEYKDIIKIDDLNMYIEGSYDSFSDKPIYSSRAKECKLFLPSYETLKYKQFLNGFYILDGENTSTYLYFTFVLEMIFDNNDDYQTFLQDEYQRVEYTNEFNIKLAQYDCLITKDEQFTNYGYGDKYPRTFGLLCQNFDELTIRFVFYSATDSVKTDFSDVIEYTNCKW